MRRLKILVFTLALAACSRSPDATLSKYLDATYQGNFEEAYSYISSRDQSVKSQEAYLRDQQSEGAQLARTLANKYSYKIKDTAITEDHAKVTAEITGPDLGAMMLGLFGAALQSGLGNQSDHKATDARIADSLKDKKVPEKTVTEYFEMIKEDDGWKVFLGWRYSALVSEAKVLVKEKKFADALEKYERALQEKPGGPEAASERDALRQIMEKDREKRTYIPSIELQDFRVGQGQKFAFGNPEPAVFGRVVNKGSRNLRMVEIKVFFLGSSGLPIAETTYFPVNPHSLEGTVLKTGYEKEFGYVIGSAAPSNWSGSAKAEISDLEFE